MPTRVIGLAMLVVLAISATTHAQVLDASRSIDWSTAGIVGGVPTRTTICATFSAGATAAQINSAIAACPSGQVVKLNAGTYSIGGLMFDNKSDVTLRGAGANQTFITFSSPVSCGGLSSNICVKSVDSNYADSPSHTATWSAGYTRGATSITLSSTTNLSVGRLLILDQENNSDTDTGTIWVCSTTDVCSNGGPGGGGRPGPPRREQQQIVTVTNISGSTVTITPGLYMPNWSAGLNPGAWWSDSTVTGVGIEDLSLDHHVSDEQAGITFMNATNCWVKGIRSLVANRNHVWLYLSAKNIVRDSYFYSSENNASESYGIEQFQAADNLIENNILHHITAPIIANSANGSVVSYNYLFDDDYWNTAWMQASNYHHATGTNFLLHEGNEGVGLVFDNVHGPAFFVTAFRNYFTGFENMAQSAQTIPIHIYAYSRYHNIVGNVVGTTGYHTTYECLPISQAWGDCGGPGQIGSIGDNTSVFTVGWNGNGGTGYDGGNDPIAASTLMRWGNYDTVTSTARFQSSEVPSGLSLYANPVPGTQTLPTSLYLSAKPGWWRATMPWPAIGPDVTGGTGPGSHVYKNPAHTCYDASSKTNGVVNFDAATCYAPRRWWVRIHLPGED